jgi:hypothetical protein
MDSPPELPDTPSEFKDYKTGLVLFGILTILLGGVCALFVPLMFFGQAMSAKSGAPTNTQAIIPAIVMHAALAIALVWLGVGSMMARRWARALLLIFSWSWLIIGLISMVFMAFFLPQIMQAVQSSTPPGQPEMPAAAKSLMMIIPMVFLGVVYVILPGAWLLFYRSKHVKATCEARDPKVRWTDRCPLPVIGVSLWLAFSAAMMLMMAVAYKGILPVFGTLVFGPAGSALCVLFALLWGYCAWGLYKLDRRALWIVVTSMVVFSISAFVTYSHHDLMELYALMGYPQEQIDQIAKFNFLNGPKMAWASIGAAVPLVAYLLYIRRYFPSGIDRTTA